MSDELDILGYAKNRDSVLGYALTLTGGNAGQLVAALGGAFALALGRICAEPGAKPNIDELFSDYRRAVDQHTAAFVKMGTRETRQ
jgi:hypothetical protein